MRKEKKIFIDANKILISEKVLTDLLDFVCQGNFETINISAPIPENLKDIVTDGRVESTILEKSMAIPIIREWISKSEIARNYSFELRENKDRNWTDIDLISEEFKIFIHCNIKISNCSQPDNLNCYNGIYLALTGIYNKDHNTPFPKHAENQYDFIKHTSVYKYDKPIDFYFIVFNKNDISKSFYTSLLTMKELKVNGSNRPFQARWDSNFELGRYSLIPVTDEMVQDDLARGLVPREYRSFNDAVIDIVEKANESELKNIESSKYRIKANNIIKKKILHSFKGIDGIDND